ncbi:MAG: hypothetical protein KIS96_03600 [Bauldia sp.]|nr:hypothetical protein [Bauldia sp.]
MAVAHGGELWRTHGTASVRLEAQGYVVRHPNASAGVYGGHRITDAGRAIVQRARSMGW